LFHRRATTLLTYCIIRERLCPKVGLMQQLKKLPFFLATYSSKIVNYALNLLFSDTER
jgi:hypothetical protein